MKSHLSGGFFEVNFQKWKFSKIFGSEIFFCFTIHKKLNKSCSLDKIFLFLKKKIVSLKKTSFEILWSGVWKGGFQLMLILGLLGMYFDAAVVFVMKSSLLFRLTVAILWAWRWKTTLWVVWFFFFLGYVLWVFHKMWVDIAYLNAFEAKIGALKPPLHNDSFRNFLSWTKKW